MPGNSSLKDHREKKNTKAVNWLDKQWETEEFNWAEGTILQNAAATMVRSSHWSLDRNDPIEASLYSRSWICTVRILTGARRVLLSVAIVFVVGPLGAMNFDFLDHNSLSLRNWVNPRLLPPTPYITRYKKKKIYGWYCWELNLISTLKAGL